MFYKITDPNENSLSPIVGDILEIDHDHFKGTVIITEGSRHDCEGCFLWHQCTMGTKGFVCGVDRMPQLMEDII